MLQLDELRLHYDRPRIIRLLQKAVQHSLVIVNAGPGYGKTHELSVFTGTFPCRRVWIDIKQPDNDPIHFWGTFRFAFKEALPEIYEQLKGRKFPETVGRIQAFIREFAGEILLEMPLVLVIDNYSSIKNPGIIQLFKHLADANLDNFCMVLLTETRAGFGVSSQKGSEIFRIEAKDLRFTREEIRQYFLSKSYDLPVKMLSDITHYTDGWPAAIFLLERQFREGQLSVRSDISGELTVFDGLFDRLAFSSYSSEIQFLLIRLSLLNYFTMNILQEVGGFDPVELLTVLQENPFIFYDIAKKRYSFSVLYREYLQRNRVVVSEENRTALWRIAGRLSERDGDLSEAMDCFSRCEDYDRMLKLMYDDICSHAVFGAEQVQFYTGMLDRIPETVASGCYLYTFLRATVRLNNLEIRAAVDMLLRLTETLANAQDPFEREILSEAYWLLGGAAMLKGNVIFVDFFRRAYEAYPQNRKRLYVGNMDTIALADTEPGGIERVKEALHEAVPYLVIRGGGESLELLFLAEADYYTYKLDSARQLAYGTINAAFTEGHHNILCNASKLLARIALLCGEYDEFIRQVNFIEDYIDSNQLYELDEIKQYVRGMVNIVNRDTERINPWTMNVGRYSGRSMSIYSGGEELLLAIHLMYLDQIDDMLLLLDTTEPDFRAQGKILNILNINILRAVGLQRQGKNDAAMDSFEKAYALSYHNNLVVPYIDKSENVMPVLRLALHSGRDFDMAWIRDLIKKSTVVRKRTVQMLKSIAPAEPQEPYGLSKREQEVLQDMAMGLTREEISASRFIAVSTVKSVIASIYSKLGAVNRADAIRIASLKNLIP